MEISIWQMVGIYLLIGLAMTWYYLSYHLDDIFDVLSEKSDSETEELRWIEEHPELPLILFVIIAIILWPTIVYGKLREY